MTYRADEVGLALRLEQLENEVAELEGQRVGLEIGIAEAVDRTREARARWKKAVKATRRMAIAAAGLVAGFLGGSIVSGLAFLFIPFLAGSCVAEEFVATQPRATMDGAAAAETRCAVVVDGWAGDPAVEPDEAGCTAVVRCDGQEVYRGRGGCGTYFDDSQLEYWDHATTRQDGTPAIVIAETRRLMVLRDDEGAAQAWTLETD